jgi:hypothetical protein
VKKVKLGAIILSYKPFKIGPCHFILHRMGHPVSSGEAKMKELINFQGLT